MSYLFLLELGCLFYLVFKISSVFVWIRYRNLKISISSSTLRIILIWRRLGNDWWENNLNNGSCWNKSKLLLWRPIFLSSHNSVSYPYLASLLVFSQFAHTILVDGLHASYFYCSVSLYGFQTACQNIEDIQYKRSFIPYRLSAPTFQIHGTV